MFVQNIVKVNHESVANSLLLNNIEWRSYWIPIWSNINNWFIIDLNVNSNKLCDSEWVFVRFFLLFFRISDYPMPKLFFFWQLKFFKFYVPTSVDFFLVADMETKIKKGTVFIVSLLKICRSIFKRWQKL